MNKIFRALIFFSAILLYCNNVLAESLSDGVDHRIIKINGTQIDAIVIAETAGNIHIVSVESEYDARKYGFRAYDSLTISDYFTKTRAIAVVSGGFLSSFSPPKELGALVIDGKTISQPISTWIGLGMFCIKGNKFAILNFDATTASHFSECIQSGPLFIKDGQLRYSQSVNISSDESKLVKSNQMQSFVCTTDTKEIVIGVSTEIRLDEFSRMLREQLHCSNALRLTGYTTAGLYFADKLVGNNDYPLASVIAVFK